MAKTVEVSKAEYEYMQTVIAHDGMTIARLEVELAQAKEDIKQLLVISNNQRSCAYCNKYPGMCELCENDAEWRGYRG